MRRNGGFSLTELVVVIGIGALITAISFPAAKTLTAGNRMMTCASRLQNIGQAMKLYRMDEGAPPPYYPEPDGGGSWRWAPAPPRPDNWQPYVFNPATMYDWEFTSPGLLALLDAGYLRSESALNCPADRYHRFESRYSTDPVRDPDDPAGAKSVPKWTLFRGRSYVQLDPAAQTDDAGYAEGNRYAYLSSRGLQLNPTDPLVRRQLAPLRDDGRPRLARGISIPDDQTVITWCPYHYDHVKEGKEGQYQALFWDGSVHKMPGSLFRDGIEASAAWVVTPKDDPTP